MMRRVAALVVLTLLCTGACSTQAKAPVQVSGRPITTTTTARPTTTTVRPTTTTKKPAPLPTKGQLQAELLTLRDLPKDWRVDLTADKSNDPAAGPACLKALDDGVSKTTVRAKFVSGNGFPSIDETLDTYPAEVIGSELAKAAHVMDSCGSFAFSSGGLDFTGKITRIPSFPTFGDQTAAWDMALQSRGAVFHMALVMVAQRTTALSFSYGVQGDDAVSPAQTYLSAATAKL